MLSLASPTWVLHTPQGLTGRVAPTLQPENLGFTPFSAQQVGCIISPRSPGFWLVIRGQCLSPRRYSLSSEVPPFAQGFFPPPNSHPPVPLCSRNPTSFTKPGPGIKLSASLPRNQTLGDQLPFSDTIREKGKNTTVYGVFCFFI